MCEVVVNLRPMTRCGEPVESLIAIDDSNERGLIEVEVCAWHRARYESGHLVKFAGLAEV